MSNTYQKNSRRAQPDPRPGEIAVPEQVLVSMAEIAERGAGGPAGAGRGRRAAGDGGQFDEADVTALCGPKGKHDRDATAVRHGRECGSVTLGGRRVPVTRPRVRAADGSGELPTAVL